MLASVTYNWRRSGLVLVQQRQGHGEGATQVARRDLQPEPGPHSVTRVTNRWRRRAGAPPVDADSLRNGPRRTVHCEHQETHAADGGGGGLHKALVVGSVRLWRRLLASHP